MLHPNRLGRIKSKNNKNRLKERQGRLNKKRDLCKGRKGRINMISKGQLIKIKDIEYEILDIIKTHEGFDLKLRATEVKINSIKIIV